MNVYFLVEGRRTEYKVYPQWLSVLVPALTRVDHPDLATQNHYYLFNGNGYPSILNHLRNAVADINAHGNFQYLVMCIDADEDTVQERRNEVEAFMAAHHITLNEGATFALLVQNRCIETWFLGNKRIYRQQTDNPVLRQYMGFYNVRENDPELMGRPHAHETHAQFHFSYLREMLAERNMHYTKKNPVGVTERTYLTQLIRRASTSNHLRTFQDFVSLCAQIQARMNG